MGKRRSDNLNGFSEAFLFSWLAYRSEAMGIPQRDLLRKILFTVAYSRILDRTNLGKLFGIRGVFAPFYVRIGDEIILLKSGKKITRSQVKKAFEKDLSEVAGRDLTREMFDGFRKDSFRS